MAYTKIHAVKATVDKAIAYICNPEKTDENILISSFGCSPETAQYDFKFALSKTRQSDENKAFHLIQSFLPGEVTFEEAHRIGNELADKLLEGKYSYVVSTHIDKGHVHNHLIFCAADNIEHKKYNDCKRSYYHIRHLSDDLCKEHNLSVIKPSGRSGKAYKEWQSGRNNTSWKDTLKTVIDDAVRTASSYEECMELIRSKGYEVKGETFQEKSLKYISFRPLDKENFVRGSIKSLGAEYTKERIKERIETKALELPQKTVSFPFKKKNLMKDYSSERLIDTTGEKFEQSSGLMHWAAIQNLKIAAANYSEANSISELKQQLSTKSAALKTTRSTLVKTEQQLKDLGQIIKYAEQYKTYRIYHIRYQKSKDKDAYLRRHETELLLHDGAENMLKQLGIDPKKIDLDSLRSEYNSLYSTKEQLRQTYKATEKDINALNRKLANLNQYLERETKQPPASERTASKDDNTL